MRTLLVEERAHQDQLSHPARETLLYHTIRNISSSFPTQLTTLPQRGLCSTHYNHMRRERDLRMAPNLAPLLLPGNHKGMRLSIIIYDLVLERMQRAVRFIASFTIKYNITVCAVPVVRCNMQ
jgi:hypothetical protein